jgi:hypothetical protein
MPIKLRSDVADPADAARARKELERELQLDDLENEAQRILGDEADAWLDADNARLGGLSPRQVLRGCNKEAIRDLLDSIRYGAFS